MGEVRTLRALVALLPLSLLLPATGCLKDETGLSVHRHSAQPIMGTLWNLTVVTEEPLEADEAARLNALVHDSLHEVDQLMSTYKPGSEISRFNRHPALVPFTISPLTYEVLAEAQRTALQTEGAFDVTVGPLVERWGFGAHGNQNGVPDTSEIAQLRQRTGFKLLSLSRPAEDPSILKRAEGLQLDLSAIAKGYAVDRASDALLKAGYTNHLVEVGGEIRTSGVNPEGSAWVLAIESPIPGNKPVHQLLEQGTTALATSGDYRNFYERDGKRYSHTIDPRTGAPVTHSLASVSVLAERCTSADAWATALNVLGPEAGLKLAEQQGLAAYFLVYNNEDPSRADGLLELRSPAFEALFQESNHAP